MGLSDQFLKPVYKKYLKNILHESGNLKIAWLGQQNPNDRSSKNVGMFEHLSDLFDGHCHHDFYDILNKNSWDVHEEWNIKDYDLVLCFRLTYLVQSSSHLIEQIKKTVDNNRLFIGDFVSGNIVNNTMCWRDSDNLVCFLPEYYTHTSEIFKFRVSNGDHLLNKKMINDSSLELTDCISFEDPKGRHYLISKVVKNES